MLKPCMCRICAAQWDSVKGWITDSQKQQSAEREGNYTAGWNAALDSHNPVTEDGFGNVFLNGKKV